MAPPKKKTSGRVTPKGTKPGQVSTHVGSMAKEAHHHDSSVSASSRYTPPNPKEMYESPRWVPILMAGLIVAGMLAILSRYVIWDESNIPVAVGLGLLLAGLWTATKWH
jgi:hypothetical protein